MKYKVFEINESGQPLAKILDAGAVCAMLREVSVPLAKDEASLEMDLTLSRAEETVFIHGGVKGHFWVTCSRCLEPARVDVVDDALNLTVLKGAEEGAIDVEDAIDDVDTFTHDGEELDLGPILRELMVLAIPMNPLCAEDCAGIQLRRGDGRGNGISKRDADEAPQPSWKMALQRLKETTGKKKPQE